MFWSYLPYIIVILLTAVITFTLAWLLFLHDMTRRKQSEAALRRRAEEMNALAHVSAALRTARSVEEMLPILLEQAVTLFAATIGAIFLYDPETEELICRASYPPGLASSQLRHPIGKGITGRVAMTRELYVCEDMTTDPVARKVPGKFAVLDNIRGQISLPLYTEAFTIGVMHLGMTERHIFSAAEVRLGTALADIASNAIHRAIVMSDLEAQVQARTAEIAAEQKKREAVLQSVGEAIVMFDLDTKVQYVNDAFTTLTGYTAAEALGQSADQLIKAQMPDLGRQSRDTALAQGEFWRGEMHIHSKDGRGHDVEVTIAPIWNGAAAHRGYVASYRNVSQLKELQRARQRFISNVSHELRTPAANIKLYTQLLQKGGPPERMQHYLHVLSQQSNRLEHIIEDILEITSLDSGQGAVLWETISLTDTVETAIIRYHDVARSKGVQLEADLAPPVPFTVKGDKIRIAQAVNELIENAIQFTPAGGVISVQIALANRTDQQWGAITVRDNGPGIPAIEQTYIFNRFYRGSLAEAGHIPGTGLGLSIVDEIMRAHGGRVTVDSREGEGSAFTIWLPVNED